MIPSKIIGDFFMKTAKDRFHEVMDSLGLNDYKVYTGIENISKNMMYKLRQGQTEEVSVKILMPFCEAYPQVNANYILTGKGPMFLDNETSHSSLSEKDVEDLPSPETAEYWKRMYETTVVMYEAQFEDLQRRFNALNKSVEEIQDLFSERRKAV